jgi:hypothetical protein
LRFGYRYRVNGKRGWATLGLQQGAAADMTVEAARNEARVRAGDVAKGVDPVAEKAEAKAAHGKRRFAAVADKFLESEEKREPVSDIDTEVVDSLKLLDPRWPIREADFTGSRRDKRPLDTHRARRRPVARARFVRTAASLRRLRACSQVVAGARCGRSQHAF